MKDQRALYRVLNKGGVLSSNLFLKILTLAEEAGNEQIHLGSRQDLLFWSSDDLSKSGPTNNLNIKKRDSGFQNIVSSFVCVDILPKTSWIHSGTYLTILDQFKNDHQLRINIVDPRQNLIPLFYGHLNFIASDTPNYWYLHLKLDGQNEVINFPELIFTEDIATFAELLENAILNSKANTIELILKIIDQQNALKNTIPANSDISHPSGFFPYYEGLNKIEGKDQYWGGFYWRNNNYPIQLLKEICQLCQQTNIARIYFTPWKTFLIKDIEKKDKIFWEEIIGRFGINMRHSSFELNWHLPLLNNNAFKLKKYLMNEFDRIDIRTNGLSLSILEDNSQAFTSIVIKKSRGINLFGKINLATTYNVEHAYDFNPNSNHYILYASNVVKSDLTQIIKEITQRYYSHKYIDKKRKGKPSPPKIHHEIKYVYQCNTCKTVYDEEFGDLLAQIPPKTSFESLPESYCCQLCETPKSGFQKSTIIN